MTARSAALAALLLLLPTLGCGTGGVDVGGFEVKTLDASGGVVQGGDVVLAVPPGALSGPTSIAILPHDHSIPILQDANCLIEYLGPVWCCGPIGLELNEPAMLRLSYDEGLIPFGVSESDLVFLTFDEAQNVMFVLPVTHDPGANTFTTFDYTVLGHVAVGIRPCASVPLDIAFSTGGLAFAEGAEPFPTLWLTAPDADEAEPLPSGGHDVRLFAPSPDATRILFDAFGPQENTELWTYTLGDAAAVQIVDDAQSGDPMWGWRRALGDVYFVQTLFDQSGAFPALSTVPPEGSEEPSSLHEIATNEFYSDIRQSDDGSHAALRVFTFVQSGFFERLVVIDMATGAVLSDGDVPLGDGNALPRFVPGSDDLYVVLRSSVNRYEPDGTLVETIYTPNQVLVSDFVLAPNGDGYGALLFGNFGNDIDEDAIEVGTLSGGPIALEPLGSQGFFGELVVHPLDGEWLYLDDFNVRVFSMLDGEEGAALPLADIGDLDWHASTGQLLLNVVDYQGSAGKTPEGLYVADPDGNNMQSVETGGQLPFMARWMLSTRNAPGRFASGVR
jgi:hypothetical protein